MTHDNPLLQPSDVPVDYPAVTLGNAREAFEYALDAHREGIARIIETQSAQPTWDDLVLAVDALDAQLLAVLIGLSPLTYRGQDWVALFQQSYPRLLGRFDEKLAGGELRALYQQLADSPSGQGLDAHERAVLHWYGQAFVLQGAALDEPKKQQVVDLQQQVLQRAMQFAANLQLAGTCVTEADRLQGLPARVLEELAGKARQAGVEGWLIGTDKATTQAILEQAADRDLREAVYRRHHQRGLGADGQTDNGQLLLEMADLRDRRAKLLGFADHPTLSLQSKSAGSLEAVLALLHDLADRMRPLMLLRRAELQSLADEFGLDTLQPWDRHYVQTLAHRRTELLDMNVLREHFPLSKVVEALCALADRLFGLQLVRPDVAIAVWQDSVQAFEVWLEHAHVGYLYLDAVQYPGKQADLVETRYVHNRRVDAEGKFHPAVVMVFNDVPAAVEGGEPLLDHLALRKVFHEFGHALQHLLVRTTNHVNSDVTGLGADGVEVISKLIERWTWDPTYLVSISSHHQHGGQLQQTQVAALLESLRRAEFDKAVEDLSLALFDLDLHATPHDGRSLEERLRQARDRCGYWPLEEHEHPAHGFDHLLGYYDAGYYAYVWSDVHAFDLFSRFQANGLLDRPTGRALQNALLDAGAAQPLREGMRAFLGREANADAFMAWHGLAPAE
ncbi:M3 family metallopeptidase [Pseudomonas phoenicis]|uniref:M3 family metallopeptidase n=1 Tax=unclassified Pseudomonas TaxID=196821 RepID=UPI0039A2EC47